jgi:thiamine kinase-like enzyme
MNADLDSIVARIPGWAGVQDLTVEPLSGLTNTNYLVTVNGERFVLRVSGTNTAQLGIDRRTELAALRAASSIGVGPEVVHFILPQGHLVTRYIEGRHWKYEEYRTPGNLHRLVETLKRVHTLPAMEGTFSPFRRVEAYASRAKGFHVPFPKNFDALLNRMGAVEENQRQDRSPWFKPCHNDLFFVNILDDGKVRLIDWEFAGMGDVYFDLATLVYAYDTHGPLAAELQEYLLACYFGEVNSAQRVRLEGMKYMVLFFAAMWGMLQYGLQMEGAIPAVEGFDYLQYAENIFDVLSEGIG